MYRAVSEDIRTAPLSRGQSNLMVASTSPGSFRVRFRTSEEPLSLLDPPRSEQTIAVLFELLGGTAESRRRWAERTGEKSLRSVIRFASTLASSQGLTQLRWTRPTTESDRVARVTAEGARSIAADLAGTPGTEVITVEGHLSRAQDDPPRVRVTPVQGDSFTADVRHEDLLELVQTMLFTDVQATIALQMTTSPTTGAPSTRSELLDLRRLDE